MSPKSHKDEEDNHEGWKSRKNESSSNFKSMSSVVICKNHPTDPRKQICTKKISEKVIDPKTGKEVFIRRLLKNMRKRKLEI